MDDQSLNQPEAVESVEEPVAAPPASVPPAPIVPPAPRPAVLTPLALQYLDQTRPWVLFLSIVTFMMAGLMLLFGGFMLVAGLVGSLAARNEGQVSALGGAIGMGVMSLMYVAMAILYVPAALFLYRFARAIKRLVAGSTAAALEDTLKSQRSFWRYVGILTIIGVVVMVVFIVLAFVLGAMAAVMAGRS